MYVDTTLKCPDHGEWLAVTRVNEDGETRSAGYLREETFRSIVPVLREHIATVEEHGGPGDSYLAARDLLHHIEVVMEVRS